MNIIQLKQYGTGRYKDSAPFPLGDLEVELSGIPEVSSEFRFFAYINGKKIVTYTVSARNCRVFIPAEELAAGRFSCHVEQYEHGKCVKKYPVEDLIITELDGTLSADPEIAALRREMESLSQSLEAEKKSRQTAEIEFTSALEYAREVAVGMLKFAWEDYSENVYLHGGTFEEFLSEYGIDLSRFPEEKIKEIKGDSKNAENDEIAD